MRETRSPWRRAVSVVAWLILLFLLAPSFVVVPMAFGGKNELLFPPHGLSLQLFRAYFTEPGWLDATGLSLRVASWTTLISLTLGVGAAVALVRGSFPGRRLLALFLLSPIMVPVIAIALALYIYFTRLGIRQGELRLVLGHVVVTMPFVIVTAAAGLRHVDATLETAATIMGAKYLTVLRRVTLPLLRPSLIAGGLFTFLISFDEVVISWFVARVRTVTLPVKMYSSIQWEISPVLAAISTMLTMLSVAACLAIVATQRPEAAR